MGVNHHDLIHDLPELKDKIHELKTSNNHFRKLFDEYHHLTKEIENMENEIVAASTQREEELKRHRVHLKDQLMTILNET